MTDTQPTPDRRPAPIASPPAPDSPFFDAALLERGVGVLAATAGRADVIMRQRRLDPRRRGKPRGARPRPA